MQKAPLSVALAPAASKGQSQAPDSPPPLAPDARQSAADLDPDAGGRHSANLGCAYPRPLTRSLATRSAQSALRSTSASPGPMAFERKGWAIKRSAPHKREARRRINQRRR